MKNKPQNQLFGSLVREYRTWAGLDQKTLAEMVQVRLNAWRETGEFIHEKTMNREDISRWENNDRLPSRPPIVKALAYTLAEALQRTGYNADGDAMYKELMFGTEPDISVNYVSHWAAKMDSLMNLIPEGQRSFEWDVIYTYIKARIDEQYRVDREAYMTNLRHRGDNNTE